MKPQKFANGEHDVAFIKFLLDKIWRAVETDAEKKADIKKAKEKMAKQDARTKKLGLNLHQRNNSACLPDRPKR